MRTSFAGSAAQESGGGCVASKSVLSKIGGPATCTAVVARPSASVMRDVGSVCAQNILKCAGAILDFLGRFNHSWNISNGFSLSVCTSGNISERSEEHTSELQSRGHLVCRLLLER